MTQSHHQVNVTEREGRKGRREEVGVADENRQETSQKNELCVPLLGSWFEQLAIKDMLGTGQDILIWASY